MISRNNQARIERNQQKVDAGFMSKHYPEVKSIVISMMYKQKGIGNPISRIMNFSPGSYAFFKVDCLSSDCVDGGFDLTHIINTMIRSQSKKVKGELGCVDSGTRPDHSGITYEVAIQYRIKKGFLKDGFELRESDGKGEGIFATRSFKAGEIVMNGIIEKVLEENHSHASQVGENDYVFHAGSISKVNHSCNPDCGIRVNKMAPMTLWP